MDKEIIEQVQTAEAKAKAIIAKAKNDASEMVDDASRMIRNETDKELKKLRKAELEALRRLAKSDDDEISKIQTNLENMTSQRFKDLEQKTLDVARLVVDRIKKQWL